MQSSRHTHTMDHTGRIRRSARWLARRRTALLSSALRGAAYATGAGLVGLGFYLFQQQM
ncbi:hypothetical protein ACFZCG_39315 [Streptomyces tanashiensis]|uniref:hypothetical protein n=1 Tax=Streptomyces tanashiensis TaxID=67367 RepID=UPI0036E6C374